MPASANLAAFSSIASRPPFPLPLLEEPGPSLADSYGSDEEQTSLLFSAASSTKPLSYGEMTSTAAESRTLGMARFISPDRIGGRSKRPQSWNRYSYSLSNPLKYLDPDGLAVTPVEVVMSGGQRQVTYVDSRVVTRLADFNRNVTSKGFRLEFRDVFRTQKQQDAIKTPYTKNTVGTSPHMAGLAVDVNITTTEKLQALTTDAKAAGLSPLKDQGADPVHFQASDLISRDDRGSVDQAYKDLMRENQQQAQEFEQLRLSDPAAFDAQLVKIEPVQNCPQPNRYSPCSR